jgi:hypothetical protein
VRGFSPKEHVVLIQLELQKKGIEDRRLADEKRAEERRIDDEKRAEARRESDEKKAEERLTKDREWHDM